MNIMQLCKKLEEIDLITEVRRKPWLKVDDRETCFYSDGCFYEDESLESTFNFNTEDLLADDWEYSEKAWRAK